MAARTTKLAPANFILRATSRRPIRPAQCKDTGTFVRPCLAVSDATLLVKRTLTGRPWAIGVRYNVTDKCHGSNKVSCIAFDPKDNGVLVSGSCDKTLKKWRLSSGECLATYTGHG